MNKIDFDKLKFNSIKKIGKCKIYIDTINNIKIVVKDSSFNKKNFSYLHLRNFNYTPNIYDNNELVYDFIEDKNELSEQKIEDLSFIMGILHNNTSFFKNVDLDFIKTIYEDKKIEINSLYNYYYELQNKIEEFEYMLPSSYLLIRNISKIYFLLRLSDSYLDKWYSISKDLKQIKYSYIHNNLSKNHIIENDNIYLISWDKSKISLPTYDIDILYKNSYYDTDINSILINYNKKYNMLDYEKYLLYSFILIPWKVKIDSCEINNIKNVSDLVFYVTKTLNSLEDNSINKNKS